MLDSSGIGPAGANIDATDAETPATQGDAVADRDTGKPTPPPQPGGHSPPNDGESGGEPGGESGEEQSASAARVVFAAQSLDLGEVELDSMHITTVEIRNEGQMVASMIELVEPSPPLTWATDAAQSTCSNTLAPGASCQLALAVTSGLPGAARRNVALNYVHADGSGATSQAEVTFTATGTSPNLLINPDAEDDPVGTTISGWDEVEGDFEIDADCGDNGQCFFAGAGDRATLAQQVELTDGSANGSSDNDSESSDSGARTGESAADSRFTAEFTGSSRLRSLGDDPHALELFALNAEGNVVAHQRAAREFPVRWASVTLELDVPPSATSLRVELTCTRALGTHCSARFDNLALTLRLEHR